MKTTILYRTILTVLPILLKASFSFSQAYSPSIEWKRFAWRDPRLVVKSGYFVVPENRQKVKGRKIKLPFIFIRTPEQDAVRNVNLYMVGGPGYSTTFGIDSIGYQFGYVNFGATIMFGQRGTKMAEPFLACPEVDEAVRKSFRTGLNRDSLRLLAIKQCRKRFTKEGVDLSAYNTTESAADINDLRKALGLDSLTLIGLSYSGGLMLTVLKNHPECVRTLVLRSPLPVSVNYEEHALFNFNEALETVFDHCARDSSGAAYQTLRQRFRAYFTGITGKKFSMPYLEKGRHDSINITYTKSELLDIINDKLSEGESGMLPALIVDFIEGRHKKWMTEELDGYFADHSAAALGMRYSVFCADQVLFADKGLQQQQDKVLPWLTGYRYNNVNETICSCWGVKKQPDSVKTPVFSDIPVLLGGGDLDPGCSLFYNRLIKRTLPNCQVFTRHNAGHGFGFKVDGVDYLSEFLKNPYQKLVSRSKEVVIE